MGINATNLPILMALIPENEKKFKCEIKPEDLTVDSILEFAKKIESEEI